MLGENVFLFIYKLLPESAGNQVQFLKGMISSVEYKFSGFGYFQHNFDENDQTTR